MWLLAASVLAAEPPSPGAAAPPSSAERAPSPDAAEGAASGPSDAPSPRASSAGTRANARRYATLAVLPGLLCLRGPDVSQRCFRAAGPAAAEARADVAHVMLDAGCDPRDAVAVQVKLRQADWATRTGSALLVAFGVGLFAYGAALNDETEAELIYRRAMRGPFDVPLVELPLPEYQQAWWDES